MEPGLLTTADITNITEDILDSHSITSYRLNWPAAHGLEAARKPSSRLSTHAALVSPAKDVARETRERRESAPFPPFLPLYINLFFSFLQSPKPAQGITHTLSLAPLGFRLIVQSIIYCCFGTGDIFKRVFLVPQRLYFFLEAAMIKKIRLSIDIEVTVTEIITPDLIQKAIAVTNDGKHVHIDREMLDMLQEIIHYISHHDKHHGDCLSGELFSMLTEHECDKVLNKLLNKKSFEQIIIGAAGDMAPGYEVFIKQLYQEDDESKVTNKQRDILSYILHSCLLAAKIKGASFFLRGPSRSSRTRQL
ncbi:MAG: hypothetical protein QG657_2914 [Acidobacteriota bacterium]|nr:hypothetical protein [Acidobacteriota bacterium]